MKQKLLATIITIMVLLVVTLFILKLTKENWSLCDWYISFLITTNTNYNDSNTLIHLFEKESEFKNKAVPNICSYEQFNKRFDWNMDSLLKSTEER